MLGPDGNYYGTSTEGGAFGGGTVFKVAPDGTLATVVSFPSDEGTPREALTVGSDGNLYGTTEGGPVGITDSRGTIFRVTLAGQLTTLATFVNSGVPHVSPQRLVEATDGNLYGATTYGGAQQSGELFRIAKDGTITSLVTFTGANGARPFAGMIEAADGNLYGTTSGGGANGTGTVYRLTKDGLLTTIASFPFEPDTGREPTTELTQGPDGALYGVTSDGYANSAGRVFRVTLEGALSWLGALPSQFVAPTSPLVFGDDGNLYGTTPDHFYRVSPTGGLSVLVNFNAASEGRLAEGPLLKVGNGVFLGTTYRGGTIGVNRFGVVHRLTEQGTAATVVAFPPVLGRHFNSELSEGRSGQLYGTVADDRSATSPFGGGDLGGFRFNVSGIAVPFELPTFGSLPTDGKSSRLVEASDGSLYGTVSHGGYAPDDRPLNTSATGFIYRVDENDRASTAFQFVGFGDGSSNETGDAPKGALTVGPDSALYGTASLGGAHGRGTFFKLDGEGSLSVLHSFSHDSPVGVIPMGDLIFDDGLFYGFTSGGGENETGTFFSASPEGDVTALRSFPPNTYVTADSRLILATDGHFYGVFYGNGEGERGSVFRFTKSGVLSTFAVMDANTGGGPIGIMQASDGNFYGVTRPIDGPGSIFRVDSNGAVTVVARFSEDAGAAPLANLMQASDGNLYGTTSLGGPSRGGVIYRLQILPTKELLNISTRLRVLTGENVLIGGFIVTGNEPKKVIVRAIGPSLQQSGISGALANPVLELRGPGGAFVASNNDWKTTQQTEIQASGVPPDNELEAAIVATLEPGDYTATVSGADSSTGVGLVEVYDLDAAADSRLANISTRGFVATGEDVMIAGLIAGEGSNSAKAIVRAIGPSLQQTGVDDALVDPLLELRDADGTLIQANDNWGDDPSQAAEIQASGVPPGDEREAAIAVTLPSGATTAIVRGKAEAKGVALVEVYNIQ